MSFRRSIAAVAAALSFGAAAVAIPSAAFADAATSPPQPSATPGLAAPGNHDQRTRSATTALAAATACVTGQAFYRDQNNTPRPAQNLTVQVWDRDDTSSDDLLAVGATASNGLYQLCFDNDDTYRGQDVYVKLITENTHWRVQDNSGSRYEARFDGPDNLADGSTFNFGTQMPPSSKMRAWHAFDEANDAWQFVPHDSRNCWVTSNADTACQQLVIQWTNGVVIQPPHYELVVTGTDGRGTLKLSDDTPDNRSAVAHEIGHFVMHSAYGTAGFTSIEACPDPSNHAPDRTTNAGCAWTEGFADWFSVAVYHDPLFTQVDGTPVDFEGQTYGNDWHYGDTVEGRVAGALLDLSDYTNEQPYDRFGEGPGAILNTLMYHVSHSFKEFWAWHGLSSSQARASLYQNTIDYGFRDPLTDYAELTRDFKTLGPSPLENYRYNSNTNYWSVVATRPQNGANIDLTLFDSANLSNPLATSNRGDSDIDFVAVDSNYAHRAVGDDYYPQANFVSGIYGVSGYRIELAQGADQVKAGSQTVTMQPADVVAVRDVYLHAGTPTRITVTPANSSQNPLIFLMGDDPGNSATWVQGRDSAVAASTSAAAGQAESITYNPPRDGWYGFVLLNGRNGDYLDGGSGTYTILREDLAPTGAAPANRAAAPADAKKLS